MHAGRPAGTFKVVAKSLLVSVPFRNSDFLAVATVALAEFFSKISTSLTTRSSSALTAMLIVPAPVKDVGDAETNLADGAAVSIRVGLANVVAPLFPYMSSAYSANLQKVPASGIFQTIGEVVESGLDPLQSPVMDCKR